MFIIEKKKLSESLSLISSCCPAEAGSNHEWAAFISDDDMKHVVVIAMNESVTIKLTIPTATKIERKFSFSLQHKRLASFIKHLGDKITIKVPEAFALISEGNTRYELPTKRATNESLISEVTNVTEEGFEMSADLFREMIGAVEVAAARQDDARFTLACISLYIDGSLKLRSCDGKQLAIASKKIEEWSVGLGDPIDELIPISAVTPLLRFIRDRELVRIIPGQRSLTFGSERDHLFLRGLAESIKFPDIEMVIPKEFSHEFETTRTHLGSLMERVGVASGKDHAVWCSFSSDVVYAETRDFTNSAARDQEQISCPSLGSNTVKIGLHSKALIGCLSLYPKTTFDLSFIDSTSAVKLVPRDVSFDFKYVIMPIVPREEEEPEEVTAHHSSKSSKKRK